MAAYHIQDRIEAQAWNTHYQQLAREEKESELADDLEKGLLSVCWNRCALTNFNAAAPANRR